MKPKKAADQEEFLKPAKPSKDYKYVIGDVLVRMHDHRIRPIYPPKGQVKVRLQENLVDFTVRHQHGTTVGSPHTHELHYEVEEVEVEPNG